MDSSGGPTKKKKRVKTYEEESRRRHWKVEVEVLSLVVEGHTRFERLVLKETLVL
jgi:hypothetical protein